MFLAAQHRYGQVPQEIRLHNLTIETSVTDRMDVIEPLVRTGSVLDMGIVDSRKGKRDTGSQLKTKTATSLFRKICDQNPDTLGVDIDAEGIDILNKHGFNTRHENVITMDLGQTFDTIVAGELIEHLPNPGTFLENMSRHLKPDGTLVITTPNPFYSKQTWKIWRHSQPSVHEEHTCWFDPITLNTLCQMSGLRVDKIYWVQKKKSFLKTLPARFRGYFSHSFIVLAKRA
jgi:SAM-dependent methyltransferase